MKSTASRAVLAAALACVAALAAGCGGGDDGDDGDDGEGENAGAATQTVTITAPAEDGGQPARQDDDRDDDDQDDGAQSTGGTWQRGCERNDRTGTIDMAGAGSVRLSRQGDRLSVSRVRPNEGWRASVDRDDDGDEIEVDFRRGGREVELEAEIDDGRLEVEVCRKGS